VTLGSLNPTLLVLNSGLCPLRQDFECEPLHELTRLVGPNFALRCQNGLTSHYCIWSRFSAAACGYRERGGAEAKQSEH
jgi:hypothetical protein